MSERIRKFLTLPLLLLASTAWAQEPELLADTSAATAAGFMIVDMRHRPSEEYSDLVRNLVADYARSRGVTGPVNASWAPIRLPGGEVLLAIWPLGIEFDAPGPGGGRLLVYALRNGTAADLVLETPAMAVGTRGGELAAVDENGFRTFRLQ